MVKFTEDHKKEQASNYFGEGIHKVKIGAIDFGATDDGKEYVEFTVVDDDEREGTARMWFTTEKAINYTFNIIRGIFVHNAPADKKDAIRAKIDKVKDTKELEKICEMLAGKECWYAVYKSDRTYKSNGDIKHSYDKNVYGYEPKPRTPDTISVGSGKSKVEGEEVKIEDVDGDVMAGF